MGTATDEIKDLTRALKEATAEVDAITGAFEVKDGKVRLNEEQAKAYTEAHARALQIKGLIDAKTGNAQLHAWLNAPDGTPVAGEAAAAAAAGKGLPQTLADMFIGSQEWADFKGGGFRDKRMTWATEGKGLFDTGIRGHETTMFGAKDVFSAMAGNLNVQGLGSHQQRQLVEFLPRLMHVRDIFPPDTTNAAILYGVRQTGFVNNAAPVAERRAADGTSAPVGNDTDVYGRAPKSKIAMQVVTYPITTIAHTLPAHENTLDDEPRMRGLINRNLIEGVRLEEDDQVLYGDGIGTNMRGLFNTQGVQTYNQPGGEKKVATLRRAITRVQLAQMAPTGVILNPLDWEDLELETDDNGRYLLVTSVAAGAEERVWRLPVIATTAMAEGKYMLGAFGLGAQLVDRRAIDVTVSSENSDNFERGVVTFKGSERIGLAVDRPEAFVQGAFL